MIFIEVSPESTEKILIGIVTGGVTAFIAWLLAKRKTDADIGQTRANTRKTDAETLILAQSKIDHWIEKFEQAKTEAIEMEDELADVKKKLEQCLERQSGCADFKDKIFPLLDRLEIIIKSFDEHAPIISEMRNLRSGLKELK